MKEKWHQPVDSRLIAKSLGKQNSREKQWDQQDKYHDMLNNKV